MSYQDAINELAYRFNLYERMKTSHMATIRDLAPQARAEAVYGLQLIATLTDKSRGEIERAVERRRKQM